MLKRKSTKWLFVAAYFLIFFFPYKCFSHNSEKGWGYLGNPYLHGDPASILLGEVDIEFSFNENHVLTFFQISMLDSDTEDHITLVENSPALLTALNQAIHFESGVEYIDGEFPDISVPGLSNGAPDFTALSVHPMGRLTSAEGVNRGSLRHHKYCSDNRKILGIMSAEKERWSKGPLRNLIAFSFGNKAFYVVIKTDYFDSFFEKKAGNKSSEEFDRDGAGSGGASGVVVNYFNQFNTTLINDFYDTGKLLRMLRSNEYKPEIIDGYFLLREI